LQALIVKPATAIAIAEFVGIVVLKGVLVHVVTPATNLSVLKEAVMPDPGRRSPAGAGLAAAGFLKKFTRIARKAPLFTAGIDSAALVGITFLIIASCRSGARPAPRAV
jgi:hypothetical protein